MPKQSPVPDEVDQPFWDAANEDRLVVQNCTACDRLPAPARPHPARSATPVTTWSGRR